MYKFLTSVSISLLFVSSAAAQTGVWKNIITPNTLPSGYSQMVFPNDTIGYIYGGSGTTLEVTTDSGVDFNNVPIETTLKGPAFGYYFSWPTPENGYLTADTGFSPNNGVFCVHTSNGGNTWSTSELSDPNMQLQNLYFPTTNIGYATGSLADGSGDFVAKTIDGGVSWNKIYSSTAYYFGFVGKLYFRDANNGMFFAQGNDNHVFIAYTTDGGATPFNFVQTRTDSSPNFLHWNNDNSWLIGIDSVYRSTDSGKNWTGVVPYDTLAGPATVAAFYDSVGFVFRGTEAIALETTDYGVSWTSSRLPLPPNGSAADTVIPVAASMPSSRVAYLLASDDFSSTDVMMKFDIPPPTPPPNAVSLEPRSETSFTVFSDESWLTFDVSSAAQERTIEIADLLGRQCASISVPPDATSSRLAISALQPGSYFARLGMAVVKFNIWE